MADIRSLLIPTSKVRTITSCASVWTSTPQLLPACGVCKTGRLVPQFNVRRAPPRTPKPKADSQNAAVRSRGTPHIRQIFSIPCVLMC